MPQAIARPRAEPESLAAVMRSEIDEDTVDAEAARLSAGKAMLLDRGVCGLPVDAKAKYEFRSIARWPPTGTEETGPTRALVLIACVVMKECRK